jgi:hypothetical protein
MLDRRSLLFGAAATATLLISKDARASHTGTTVGAIRWDAWYTQTDAGGIRSAVAATLGPQRWQGRAPSCATILNENSIGFDECGTQAQIDSEISAAHAAKLDYWAYCWFGPEHVMQQAWRFHQASDIGSRMNWCLLFSYSPFVNQVSSVLPSLVGYLRQSNYQKVVSGRPVIFLLNDKMNMAALADSIRLFRSACIERGAGSPYIVLLLSGPAKGVLAATGADAIGAYEKAGPTPVAGAYSDLVKIAETYWATLAATGQTVVPTAMTGWDTRPRFEHPTPWQSAIQKAQVNADRYFSEGSASAIAAHVRDLIAWIKSNPTACPARTGLIYSWNEHDEGGSTLNPTLDGGNKILDAVGSVL